MQGLAPHGGTDQVPCSTRTWGGGTLADIFLSFFWSPRRCVARQVRTKNMPNSSRGAASRNHAFFSAQLPTPDDPREEETMSALADHESELGQTKELEAVISAEDTGEATVQEAAETSKVDEGNAVQPSDDLASAPKKASSLCGVCNVNAPKYKCPRCYLP